MTATSESICRTCLALLWQERNGCWWHVHGKTPEDYTPHRPVPTRVAIPLTERERVLW